MIKFNRSKFFFAFLFCLTFLINNLLFTLPKYVNVQINSKPQGVTVYSKGMPTPLGATPLTSQFMLGRTYTLTFTKQGYQDQTITYKCDGNPIFVNMQGGGNPPNGGNHREKHKLSVSSNINGAAVYANNDLIGNTPLTARLREGTYNIKVTFNGYNDYTATVNLNSDQQIYANLQQQIMQYKLTVNSNINGASVFVNDNKIGNAPTAAVLQAATYNIRVSHHGYTDYTATVNLNSDQQIYANLQPLIIQYKLTINSNLNGANVYINGNKIGNTPITTVLQSGTYNIKVTYPAYNNFTSSVNLNSAQTIYANMQFVQNKLTINSNVNGASVYINGNKSGNIPFSALLTPGTYNISVRHPGFKDFNSTFILAGDQTIYANLEPIFGININIPNGAQLYINGERQNINWTQNEFWKVFNFTSFKEFNQVKIRYHGIDVEKSIKFDNRTISLIFDIN